MIDFIGIGAQKCGTKLLYESLAQRPQVRFPAGKEIYFWDQLLNRGINWRIALFPETASDVRHVEITPKSIGLLKALLDLVARKRAFRAKESA